MKIIKEIGKDNFEVLKNVDANLIGDIYYSNRIYNKYFGWLGIPKWYISNDNRLEGL